METALRFEINTNVPELYNKIYPTNAPEGVISPYLVYARINTDKDKTLAGYEDSGALSYMFSIMATKYSDMKSLTKKVEDLLISFPKTFIGTGEGIFIEDININNITEVWENELKVNRGIIDFTIYY